METFCGMRGEGTAAFPNCCLTAMVQQVIQHIGNPQSFSVSPRYSNQNLIQELYWQAGLWHVFPSQA